jgi:hypothetical protein
MVIYPIYKSTYLRGLLVWATFKLSIYLDTEIQFVYTDCSRMVVGAALRGVVHWCLPVSSLHQYYQTTYCYFGVICWASYGSYARLPWELLIDSNIVERLLKCWSMKRKRVSYLSKCVPHWAPIKARGVMDIKQKHCVHSTSTHAQTMYGDKSTNTGNKGLGRAW